MIMMMMLIECMVAILLAISHESKNKLSNRTYADHWKSWWKSFEKGTETYKRTEFRELPLSAREQKSAETCTHLNQLIPRGRNRRRRHYVCKCVVPSAASSKKKKLKFTLVFFFNPRPPIPLPRAREEIFQICQNPGGEKKKEHGGRKWKKRNKKTKDGYFAVKWSRCELNLSSAKKKKYFIIHSVESVCIVIYDDEKSWNPWYM